VQRDISSTEKDKALGSNPPSGVFGLLGQSGPSPVPRSLLGSSWPAPLNGGNA
jgi:hypothetical protein